MTSALTPVDRSQFMPAMSIELAVERYNTITEFVSRVLRRDVDYGIIPGTDKLTLLKPGAEKLTTFFGLSTRFQLIERIEDWTGDDHNGEPFFYYLYRCQLYRGDLLVAEADGSCNSREQKYRYREAQRVCTECGHAAIIKGKEEYGGGWLCFRKKGGCGAKFATGDAAIESQQVGRVPNPEIADQVNTIQKMGQKRCLGSTVPLLIKTSRSVSRGDVGGLYEILQKATEPVMLPGIDGTWRTVMGMTRLEGKEIWKVDLADGSVIRATAEHRFPTLSGMKTVAELQTGSTLLRSDLPPYEGNGALPEFGWVAGLFLAEGHFPTPTSARFTLNSNEGELAERVIAVARSLGATSSFTPRSQGHTADVRVYGHSFCGLMRQFIDGGKSYGKHLSRFAWSQGKEFLHALLEGYLAGDGSETKRPGRADKWRLGFTGENYELANDLRCLSALLGYRFSLKRSNARLKGVDFSTFSGWIAPTSLGQNLGNPNEVVSITKESRLGTVFDIEVDGDHLFCLANGIQTHNSLVAATLLAVNASEFFTQDVEDFIHTPAVSVDASAAVSYDEQPAGSGPVIAGGRKVSSASDAAMGPKVEESDIRVEILAACRRLGKTEDQLVDWLKRKYEIASIDELSLQQKREVLAFLHNRIAKEKAA